MPPPSIKKLNSNTLGSKVNLSDGTTTTYSKIVDLFVKKDVEALNRLKKQLTDIFFGGEKVTILGRLLFTENASDNISFAIKEMNCPVDILDEEKITTLFYTVEEDDVDSTRVLIENGADVNYITPYSGTTTIWNVQSPQMFQLLVQSGASLELEKTNNDDVDYSEFNNAGSYILSTVENETIKEFIRSTYPHIVERDFHAELLDARSEECINKILAGENCSLALMNNVSRIVLAKIMERNDMKLFVKALETGININENYGDYGSLLEDVIPSNYLRTKIMLQHGAKVYPELVFFIRDMKTYKLLRQYGFKIVPSVLNSDGNYIDRERHNIEPELLELLQKFH